MHTCTCKHVRAGQRELGVHVRLCMCVHTLREGIALWRGGAAHLWDMPTDLLYAALPTGRGQLVCNLLSSLQERERRSVQGVLPFDRER